MDKQGQSSGQGKNSEEDQSRQGQSSEDKQEKGSDPLETVVSLVSALLLLGAVAFLVWETFGVMQPPAFEAQPGPVWISGEHYYLPLTVHNTGGESVQSLELSVMLKKQGKTAAQAESSLQWLPAHSHRKMVVIFDEDPRQYELEIGFKGYELP